jgi:hypothetical protein
MTINEKLAFYLDEKGVDVDTALLYLLGIHFDLDTSKLPELTKKQVNVLNIVDKNLETKEIIWEIPLFTDQETKWEWVTEYRQLFRDIRQDAGGSLKDCIFKMQRYFAENPEIRREEIMEAAKLYIHNFKHGTENPKYMQRADYFIYKGKGLERTSRLEQYIEIYMETRIKEQSKHIIR